MLSPVIANSPLVSTGSPSASASSRVRYSAGHGSHRRARRPRQWPRRLLVPHSDVINAIHVTFSYVVIDQNAFAGYNLSRRTDYMARHHYVDGAWHEDGDPRLHDAAERRRATGRCLTSGPNRQSRRSVQEFGRRQGGRLCPPSPTGQKIVHYINPEIYAQGDELDPASIPVLVYVNTAHGAVLSAAMYLMPQGAGTSDPPQPGGCLTQWHVHTDLCIGDGKVVGTNQAGPCATGSFNRVTPPMMHVWMTPVAGGPLAPDPSARSEVLGTLSVPTLGQPNGTAWTHGEESARTSRLHHWITRIVCTQAESRCRTRFNAPYLRRSRQRNPNSLSTLRRQAPLSRDPHRQVGL